MKVCSDNRHEVLTADVEKDYELVLPYCLSETQLSWKIRKIIFLRNTFFCHQTFDLLI